MKLFRGPFGYFTGTGSWKEREPRNLEQSERVRELCEVKGEIAGAPPHPQIKRAERKRVDRPPRSYFLEASLSCLFLRHSY